AGGIAEDVGLRDRCARESEPVLWLPVGGGLTGELDAGGVGVEEKETDGAVARPRGDEDARREVRSRDAHLDPVQTPAPPLGSRGRPRRRRILGGGLEEGRAENELTAHHLGEEAFALLRRAELAHGKGAEEERRPDGNRRHRAPDLLDEHAELEEAET